MSSDVLAAFTVGLLVGLAIGVLIQVSIFHYVEHIGRRGNNWRGETLWQPSGLDPDVEVRWKDGRVESRLRPRHS